MADLIPGNYGSEAEFVMDIRRSTRESLIWQRKQGARRNTVYAAVEKALEWGYEGSWVIGIDTAEGPQTFIVSDDDMRVYDRRFYKMFPITDENPLGRGEHVTTQFVARRKA